MGTEKYQAVLFFEILVFRNKSRGKESILGFQITGYLNKVESV
jgi:hypothetical protein